MRQLLLMGGRRKDPLITKALKYNPIAFWPLVKDCKDYSGNGFDGVGSGITFEAGAGVNGNAAAYFDNSHWVDVYSAALAAAWNGDEFVIGGYFRQTAAALADGAYHDMPIFYSGTADNYAFFRSINGNINVARTGSAVTKTWTSLASGFGEGWRSILMRCTLTGDYLRMFHNGVGTSATVTGNGAWQGSLSSTGALFGASAGDHSLHRWLGWMNYVGVWPLLSLAETADLGGA